MKFRTASPRSWPGGTGSGESPLPFCHPRILSRPTYVLTSPGWASVIRMESGNGWMGRTMRPTSSECLGFLCLFPPSVLLLQGLTHSPFSPAWILFHLFFLAGCFPLTIPPPPPQELEARPAGWLSWAWAGWGWGLCPFLPQWWVEWRWLPKTLLLDLWGWTEQRQLREGPPAWEMAGWGRGTLFLVGEQ